MKVYHGGTDIVTRSFVSAGRDELDFGKGFYVTNIREQAESWAKRLADRREAAPILNMYELDMEKVTTCYHYKKFESYNLEWLDFIVANRQGKEEWRGYDLIEGGVANDRVIDTVESYIAELISVEKALERLAHHTPNNQLCITNQKLADECLHFIESIKL
ncbi:MAG: DUF3990 domain-containing protein [Prevotellaceae bacterium]|jgi:hypothetical protein|nr:DUF3990 domain-containing protein [Prevotellaceae bacterium]